MQIRTANAAPALGPSRARVLDELCASEAALGVADVAGRVGLHPNTARFHLDALVAVGLAERSREPATHAGRPRILYGAKEGGPRAGARSYQLLAEILTGHLAAHSRRPATTASDAGREWGRYLAQRPAPFQRTTADEATRQLLGVLTDIGFVPEEARSGRRREIWLNHCPFRELAAVHGEVVCSIHLGLAQGLLDELDAPLVAERVEAYATPSRCVIHLARR